LARHGVTIALFEHVAAIGSYWLEQWRRNPGKVVDLFKQLFKNVMTPGQAEIQFRRTSLRGNCGKKSYFERII
jgi:hypothetical protein